MPATKPFAIAQLGEPRHPSPLNLSTIPDDQIPDYTPPDATIPLDPVNDRNGVALELAGPRERNYFRGPEVVAAIVTCGGLSPGLNNVIRGLVLQLWHNYGARQIHGIRYGFAGLSPEGDPPLRLDPAAVRQIHHEGGTVLGSSRGPVSAATMVDALQRLSVNALFAVGGDGTMRGTLGIYEEVTRRGAQIAVIGVPKTIDNDIPYVERTFGYETAVCLATQALHAAHVEAEGALNGLGLVRLMGRHSGFIAASAALASREANLVLVPELPFELGGDDGVLAYLRRRLVARRHAVVVVSEGAGQELLAATGQRDASGNLKLGDIGTFLRDAFKRELADLDPSVKYIDPSYIIRAQPAIPGDAIFCGQLAEDAVHAAMAGKTGMVVGRWLGHGTHVPLAAITSRRKSISLDSSFWRNVVESTGQPSLLGGARTPHVTLPQERHG